MVQDIFWKDKIMMLQVKTTVTILHIKLSYYMKEVVGVQERSCSTAGIKKKTPAS